MAFQIQEYIYSIFFLIDCIKFYSYDKYTTITIFTYAYTFTCTYAKINSKVNFPALREREKQRLKNLKKFF